MTAVLVHDPAVSDDSGTREARAVRSSDRTYSVAASTPRIPREVPAWHEQSACRLFPELSWVHPGAADVFSRPAKAVREAAEFACKVICAACPVRFQCALGALERGEPWGIWGGLDRQDRKAIAIEFGFPLPGDPPPHGTNARRVKWGCPCAECKAAHALYEAQRRERARRRLPPSASCEPAPSQRSTRQALRLNLAAYHRRYRCRIGRG